VNLKEIQAFRSVSFIAIVAVIATPIERRRNRFYDRLGSPCHPRDINTPEVRDALDLLEPHIKPEWLIPQFRQHALQDRTDNHVEREGQQQVLRPTFDGIRDGVKELVGRKMDTAPGDDPHKSNPRHASNRPEQHGQHVDSLRSFLHCVSASSHLLLQSRG
jgi:hypothetical protein